MSTSIFISATEARQSAFAETIVHAEGRTIEDAILAAINAGYYETTVSTGTTMTINQSTPLIISAIDTTKNTITMLSHPYKTGDTITVSSNGDFPVPLAPAIYYYVIYVDRNTIRLASSYSNAIQPIPIAISLSSSGSGTITASLYPPSQDYYNAWQNLPTSNSLLTRPYMDQIATIISYFTNLGYTIVQQTNPNTSNSFQWHLLW